MKKAKKIAIISVVCLIFFLLLFWIVSIVRCEVMTRIYVSEFDGLYKDYTMFEEPDEVKIIEYTDTYAVIYCRNECGGDVVYFTRTSENASWQFVEWITVWSNGGSASGFVWPYFR